MPPKPFTTFLKQDSRRSYGFGPSQLKKYPELAGLVLEVISYGSGIESLWGRVLISLLKAEVEIGLGMYEGIISTAAKQGALRGAARAALGDDDLHLLEAVMDTTKAARERRNDFAHHLWGASDLAPDCLLLMNPKHLLRQTAAFAKDGFIPFPAFQNEVEKWQHQIMVYDRTALEESVEMLAYASRVTFALSLVLDGLHRQKKVPQLRPHFDNMRQQLLSERPIQEWFHKRK
jgi:hypothetical protein